MSVWVAVESLPLSFDNQAVRHAFTWLLVGNAAGLVLALLLVFPQLNDILAPLTYGRLAPVHHNVQLYGWCALPLVAVLGHVYLNSNQRMGWRAWLIDLWSLVLVSGCISWLGGSSSAKPFMEWRGTGLALFAMALVALWLGLGTGWFSASNRWRSAPLKSVALLLLGLVPIVFVWAARPQVYPAVNPASGGATGTSLLMSSLGIFVILMLVPRVLGCQSQRIRFELWAILIVTLIACAVMSHGDVSHHDLSQIVGLALVLIWPYLLYRDWMRAQFGSSTRNWMISQFAWLGLLVVDGWVLFLPGVLERLKFGHGLVAHAHMAMAGFWSSATIVILAQIDGSAGRVARDPIGFVLWQVGTLSHVLALTLFGVFEWIFQSDLMMSGSLSQTAMWLRFFAGLCVALASWRWFRLLMEKP